MFMVNNERNVEFVSDNVVNYLQYTPVGHCLSLTVIKSIISSL